MSCDVGDMPVYISIHYTHIYRYVCTYLYVHTYSVCKHMCIHIYICTIRIAKSNMHIHKFIYIYIYVDLYIYIYVHVHNYIYTHMHVHGDLFLHASFGASRLPNITNPKKEPHREVQGGWTGLRLATHNNTSFPEPRKDPRSRTPNSGLWYSFSDFCVDSGTARWNCFLDPPRGLGCKLLLQMQQVSARFGSKTRSGSLAESGRPRCPGPTPQWPARVPVHSSFQSLQSGHQEPSSCNC